LEEKPRSVSSEIGRTARDRVANFVRYEEHHPTCHSVDSNFWGLFFDHCVWRNLGHIHDQAISRSSLVVPARSGSSFAAVSGGTEAVL
jgi:hypothetical protein